MRRIGLPLMCVFLAVGLLLTSPAASDSFRPGPPEGATAPPPGARSPVATAESPRPIGFDIADADAARPVADEAPVSWAEADAAAAGRKTTLAARPVPDAPELLPELESEARLPARSPFARTGVAEVALPRAAPAAAPVEPSAPRRARTVSIPGVLLPEKPASPSPAPVPEPLARLRALGAEDAQPAPAASTPEARVEPVPFVAAPEALTPKRPSAAAHATTAPAPHLEPAVMMAMPDDLAPAVRATKAATADAPAVLAPTRREPESPVAVAPAHESGAPVARRMRRPGLPTGGTLVAAPEAPTRTATAPAAPEMPPATPSVRTAPSRATAAPAAPPAISRTSTTTTTTRATRSVTRASSGRASNELDAALARVASFSREESAARARPTAPAAPPAPPIARTPDGDAADSGEPAAAAPAAPDPRTDTAAREKIRAEARRVEARALFRQGVSLFEAQAYEQALALFETAVELDPDFAEAQDYRRRTLGLLGRSGPDEADRVLEGIIRGVEHSRQAAEIQLRTELDRAEQLYLSAMEPSPERQDLPRGIQIAEEIRDLRLAREKIDQVATLLAGSTFAAPVREELRLRMEALGERIAQALERRMEEQDAIARREAVRSTEEMRERTARTQEEQVTQLIEQARFYMDRYEYDKAIEIAREILESDPDNSRAESLLQEARQERHQYTEWELQEDWDYRRRLGHLNQERWFSAQSEDLEYPDNWDEVLERSSRYTMLGEATEAEQEIRRRLQNTRASVDFPSLPLRQALQRIAEIGNVNIAIDDTDPDDPVDPEAPVNLSVTDQSLASILDWTMRLTDNEFQIQDEVIWVTRTGSDRTFLEIYSVADLTAAALDFYPEEDDDDDDDGIEDLSLPEVIQQAIHPDSWEEEGVSIDAWEDNLIVNQTKEVHDAIREYLDGIRRFTKQQVLVDMRLLDVNQDWLEEIGFQWDSIDGRSWNQETGDHVRTDIGFNPVAGATSFVNEGGIQLDGLFNLGDVAFWRNLQVDGFLHAVRRDENGTILHHPRLLVTSGSNARMEVTTNQEYVTDYEVEDDVVMPVKEEFEQGISFGVRPIVSFDGKYVTLRLSPTLEIFDQENTRVLEYTWWNWFDPGGGAEPILIQYTNASTYFASTTQQIRTTATIPDGGTILLGGLVRDDRFERISGVPMISNIPYLGTLFRSRQTEVDGSNLIFMVGANIIELE